MNTPATNGDTGNLPARARRRFDAQMICEIAQLCAKSLTEAEACRRLGVNPKSWFSFKSRCGRTEKFAALLEEFRAGRIESLIAKIENAADGIGLKQPDWRAAGHLLAIADARRFSDSGMRANAGETTSTLPCVIPAAELAKAISLAIKWHNEKSKVVDVSDSKQIQDAEIVSVSK
jgi:Transposase